ncbi:hypothetical protein E4U10_006734, partial [Claviceps purpurea]
GAATPPPHKTSSSHNSNLDRRTPRNLKLAHPPPRASSVSLPPSARFSSVRPTKGLLTNYAGRGRFKQLPSARFSSVRPTKGFLTNFAGRGLLFRFDVGRGFFCFDVGRAAGFFFVLMSVAASPCI